MQAAKVDTMSWVAKLDKSAEPPVRHREAHYQAWGSAEWSWPFDVGV